ncbi:pisatin demethylase cytochrome P450 monooxygenase [Fusarium tjaetaba]|uniref:Pisatin demethylase cytochrome P450 monooxygenase n=1 Tax=Fusarium tjaetaba TaxID=1567544 RepID=A0A8H5VUB5_9HYPO|nr:pisatin demethylase cytochrome P450 monooxygenase [Fusarium tjaetaba]KAF5633649.1 pisatin demethylase cytochrome P450 monooxygenase [Fusarium tjaetaba]
MGFKDEIHLAHHHTQWAASQPDAVLSPIEGFRGIDKGDWNSGHASYIQGPWQSIVIKKDMGRFLEILATAVDDELQYAIPEYIKPKDGDEVDVYEAMKWIVAQVSSRFTVGLPLCRDKEYLKDSLAFADLFILNSGLLIYTPLLLKPLIGFLVTLPTRYRRWKIQKHIQPLYEERTKKLLNPGLYEKGEEPIDNLQMMMRYAISKHGNQVTPSQISDRLCLASLASFHQTAVAISNVLLNIAASDAEFNTVAVIQKEMADKDSVLRESMTTHGFGNRAMIRKVVAPDGLKTPDGHALPNGSTMSILSYPVHRDPDIYEDPEKFYPFRFSNMRTSPDGKDTNPTLSFVSTSQTYLPFGHGKHACLGRFLVDFEMEMILYHVLNRFDIELLPEHNGVRPESRHLFNQERLVVTSPEGLKEVLGQNSYDYVKPHLLRAMVGKILGYGLLLSAGDVHKLQRKNLMPAFSFRHIKELYPVFWSNAQELVHGIEKELKEESTSEIDIVDWASRASMDIIGSAGMGHEFRSLADPSIEDTMKMYGSMVKQSRGAKLLTVLQLVLPSIITDYLPFQRNMGVLPASKAARETSQRLINAKKVQMAAKEKLSPDIISTALESGHFTDEGLVDTMMTFLAAGHETSAAALTWTIFLLAKNHDIQDRLREEIRQNVDGLTDDVDAKRLDSLSYLHAVCQESLRLYAPIPFTVRDALKDTQILGTFIPKGTMVVLCLWAINRAHELWGPDADDFNPERWMAPGQANSGGSKSNYAFLTFLHGPRGCVGQKFSLAELMALTCVLVGRYRFDIDKDYEVRDITDGIVAKPKTLRDLLVLGIVADPAPFILGFKFSLEVFALLRASAFSYSSLFIQAIMSIADGSYARGDLLNGCKDIIPGLQNAYGYVPSLAAGIVFCLIFAATGIYHIVRSFQKRKATSYLLAISSYIELIGWIGRTWSSKCAYNKIAFLLQITTLVVAPIFVAAAIYVTLGYLIKAAGGGGLASGAANKGKDTKPGAKLMVSGIIFQLVSMTDFCTLFAIFVLRTRGRELTKGQRFVIYATITSVVFVYIRCIYRTVELLEGWDGKLMKTEGYFIGLDGVCIAVAILVFCIFDPAVLLDHDKQPELSFNELNIGSAK